jgi:hypothetical protein
VLLLGVVSTENCIFQSHDPRMINTIGTGIQLSFMAVLLFVHLCIYPETPVTSGGMFISKDSFFAKKNQDYAELASRIG